MAVTEPQQPDRSLGELMSSMAADLSTLLRKEVELAKVELREEARKASRAGIGFGGAAACGLLAGVALVMAIGFAIDIALPAWAAFAILTAALGLLAYVMVKRGQAELEHLDPKPEATIETLKEDAQWLSERKS